METAAAGFRLVPAAQWEAARARLGIAAPDLVLGPHALAVARAVEADVAATGLYRVEDSRISIDIKFYDVKEGRLIASAARSGRTGLAVYNLVSEAVLEVVSLPGKPLAPVPSGLLPPDEGVRMLAVTSVDEGAEVLVAGRPATTISEGRGQIPTVTTDFDATIESRKSGYHTRAQRVRVRGEEAEIRLRPLWTETRWAGEVLYTSGQLVGLGLGARYYFAPDRFFVSGDNYFYVQSALDGSDSPVFHDDLRFLAGWYPFLGPYAPVRVGVAVGVGGIVTVFSDRETAGGFDPYLSPANLWIEWNTRRWSLYWRVEGKYAAGAGGGLLERGWLELPDMGPPMTVGVVYKW